MQKRVRIIVAASIGLALAVFLVVQDRITAAGAREYVARQRAAQQGEGPPVAIDDVMRPAVRRSVVLGTASGVAVLGAGLAIAEVTRRTRRR